MALLENRVKKYKTFKKGKSNLFKTQTFPSLNFFYLIFLSIIFFSYISIGSNSLDRILVEINGFTAKNIFAPARNAINSSVNLILNISQFNRLHLENLNLKLENQRLYSKTSYTRFLEHQTKNLENTLKLVSAKKRDSVVTEIISKSSNDTESMAIVAAGSKNGIKQDNLVLSNGNLVGRIVTVSKNYSKILLADSYKSRIPVKTETTGLNAILVGSGSKNGYLIHLHGKEKPKDGELIVTSGEGDLYPRNIPVAVISKTQNDNVEVILLDNLSDANFVEVFDLEKYY